MTVEARNSDPLVGTVIGGYEVQSRLGSGAMGLVYQALQPDIGKLVAIKVLRPEAAEDDDQVRRLKNEARTVNAIHHRGIVNIFDAGALPDGRPYVVMELVKGPSVEELLEKGPMDPHEALFILDELLAALGAAHRAGVLHRDVKPSNVHVVTQDDGTRYVKLLDFGVARGDMQPGAAASRLVGTPDYMAPEMVHSTLTFASDLYAVGVMAFRMLTGRLPFNGNNVVDVIRAHQSQIPVRPSGLRPGLVPEFDGLILSLLEKLPARRPKSADEVRATIAKLRKRKVLLIEDPLEPLGDETMRPFKPGRPLQFLPTDESETIKPPPADATLVPRAQTEEMRIIGDETQHFTPLAALAPSAQSQNAPTPLEGFAAPPPESQRPTARAHPVVDETVRGEAMSFSAEESQSKVRTEPRPAFVDAPPQKSRVPWVVLGVALLAAAAAAVWFTARP